MQSAVRAGIRLDWLDYLRLVCALWVMFGHYLWTQVGTVVQPGVSGYGFAGELASYTPVALFTFLMMSGMVITIVAQSQKAGDFAAHRFARIYPTFFLIMTATALLASLGPERIHVSLTQYLANLAINAPLFGERFVATIYWTLVIEIWFYFAMLLVIATGAVRRLQAVVTVWVLLQAAAVWLPWQLPLIGMDYAFLAAGAVFALLYQRRNEWLNLALLAILLPLCIRCTFHYGRAYGYDPVIAGIATTLLFALFLFMRGRNPTLPAARRVGSMTYALYLLHFHVGAIIFYHWIDEGNKWWLVLGTSAAVIAISFAIDHIIEFRLRPFWLKLSKGTVGWPFAWWERRRASRRVGAPQPISSG